MTFQFSDGEFTDPIATSLKMWKKINSFIFIRILRHFRETEQKSTSMPPPGPSKKFSFTHCSLAPPLENVLRGPCPCTSISKKLYTQARKSVIIISQCANHFKLQSTSDNSNLQGKSKKVRVIESSSGSQKQIAGSKGKTSFYSTVNILITFNCRNVKLKWNDAS